MPLVDDSVVVRRGNPEGGPTRQDTYRITATIDNKNWGVWDKLTGGEVDSDETKYKPGGMAPHVSLGGSRTTGNLTLSRLYRLARDHNRVMELINGAGKARVVVSKQPLDIDGNVFGAPLVYTGTLKRVMTPEVDSESSSAGLLEIEITPDGFPVKHA